MISIIFAIVSLFGWALSDLFVTINSRKLNAYSSSFWTFVITICLLSLLIPFRLNDLNNLTIGIFFLNCLLGLFFLIGIITFRQALIGGSSPLMVVIASCHAVITTILSIIFFKESLNYNQILSIILVFLGLLLSLLDFKQLLKGKFYASKGTYYALVASMFFGIYFTFIKIPVMEIGWFWPNYFSFIFFIPILFMFIKIRKIKFHKPTYNNALVPLILATITGRIGELSFNLGIANGYNSVVAPIAGSNPVLFVILSAIFLRDPMTRQQIIGILITLFGIITLLLTSI